MKTFPLLTLASLALLSSCTKQEAPKSADQVQADAPVVAPAAAAKPASDEGIFKYTITTDLAVEGEQIEILVAMNPGKFAEGGPYSAKYDLDCEGDGTFEHQGLTDNKKCVYQKNSGRHQIWLRGEIPSIVLCARKSSEDEKTLFIGAPVGTDHSKNAVVSVDSWGNVAWKSMHYFATDCEALNKLPEGSPDLSQVKDMGEMFAFAKSFNQPIGHWDVSNVTDMSAMFGHASAFNQPLEKWNVSNVTNMSGMFFGATRFNQPLEAWDVSKVRHMASMFADTPFNQPLENWNVSSAISTDFMFSGAKSFNQPLGKWDVSNVVFMRKMFADAESFDQPLEQWNIANAEDMREMFKGAKAFSHYPKNWVVPADASSEMFKDTKVEAEAAKAPLKTK